MNIIRHKGIFLSISAILVLVSAAAIVVYGFRLGIDFVGGSLWQIKAQDAAVTKEVLKEALTKVGIADATVTETNDGSMLIRSKELTEEEHQSFKGKLNTEIKGLEELRFETIGGAVGRELRTRAITAFVLVLIMISVYIAFAFRGVSRPVSSWKYGGITLITLFHDAIIPAGVMAILGHFVGVEIDTNFIVALLVVMGFSVHDTIVVFDRIRENVKGSHSGKTSFIDLVNISVNQTFARSINTSLTLILVLIALYLLGSVSLTYFVLMILIGTVVGAYSSIFVASPLLTLSQGKK